MAKSLITFEDVGDTGEVKMTVDIPDINKDPKYTGSVHMILLLNYIIKNEYHKQFEKEYFDNEVAGSVN